MAVAAVRQVAAMLWRQQWWGVEVQSALLVAARWACGALGWVVWGCTTTDAAPAVAASFLSTAQAWQQQQEEGAAAVRRVAAAAVVAAVGLVAAVVAAVPSSIACS